MNEDTLKSKWCRYAKREGFATKRLGPHQIPGLPDLIAMDRGLELETKSKRRGRCHWVEAKVAKPVKRSGSNVFSADRDATTKQIEWLALFAALGIPSWWLVLSEDCWALVPGTQMTLTKAKWDQLKRPYKGDVYELMDSTTQNAEQRKLAVAETDATMEAWEQERLNA